MDPRSPFIHASPEWGNIFPKDLPPFQLDITPLQDLQQSSSGADCLLNEDLLRAFVADTSDINDLTKEVYDWVFRGGSTNTALPIRLSFKFNDDLSPNSKVSLQFAISAYLSNYYSKPSVPIPIDPAVEFLAPDDEEEWVSVYGRHDDSLIGGPLITDDIIPNKSFDMGIIPVTETKESLERKRQNERNVAALFGVSEEELIKSIRSYSPSKDSQPPRTPCNRKPNLAAPVMLVRDPSRPCDFIPPSLALEKAAARAAEAARIEAEAARVAAAAARRAAREDEAQRLAAERLERQIARVATAGGGCGGIGNPQRQMLRRSQVIRQPAAVMMRQDAESAEEEEEDDEVDLMPEVPAPKKRGRPKNNEVAPAAAAPRQAIEPQAPAPRRYMRQERGFVIGD